MIKTLNEKACVTLLKQNFIGHLGYIYNNRPYVLPITYFLGSNNEIIGYSQEGHKTMAMRKNTAVALEVAIINSVTNWSSVLAHGFYKELSSVDAKASLHEFVSGVKSLAVKKGESNMNFIKDFSNKIDKNKLPIIFKINIEEVTGRVRTQ